MAETSRRRARAARPPCDQHMRTGGPGRLCQSGQASALIVNSCSTRPPLHAASAVCFAAVREQATTGLRSRRSCVQTTASKQAARMGWPSLYSRLVEREAGALSRHHRHASVPWSVRQSHTFLKDANSEPALVRRLTQVSELSGHEAPVTGMSWNAEGTRLLSSGDDCRVKLWDIQRPSLLRTIETVKLGTPAPVLCRGAKTNAPTTAA